MSVEYVWPGVYSYANSGGAERAKLAKLDRGPCDPQRRWKARENIDHVILAKLRPARAQSRWMLFQAAHINLWEGLKILKLEQNYNK